MSMLSTCYIQTLNLTPYDEALTLQNRLVEARATDGDDTLLLLEHPPTYTLGTLGHDEYLLLSPKECARRGIAVVRTDRGGDITYHGPGQLVGYPILQLPRRPNNLHADVLAYVRGIEETLIKTLADFDITAFPIKGLTGVWVNTPQGEAKIAAIGVKVNVKAITKHGFALNVNTDLSYFDGIIPCGIQDKGVISIAALLGEPMDMALVRQRLVHYFGETFGYTMRDVKPEAAL